MSTEPIAQAIAALHRVELAGSYHRAARARRIAVPQIELTALEHLEALGGLTPGALGHRLGLTSGGVTALTGRLIDAGYVTSQRHPEDGRMRVLTVTPAGAERLREQMEPVLDPVAEALRELSPAEAELLAALLEDLAERREAAAAATPGPERVFQTDGYSRALLM
jgi:MarR family transcriptional regulator, transcriptional regulator for hemolysin